MSKLGTRRKLLQGDWHPAFHPKKKWESGMLVLAAAGYCIEFFDK
jgi:hypothetical protein